MTEAQWLTTDNVNELYTWITSYRPTRIAGIPKLTRRLGSLYAVACVRATPQTASQPVLIRAADEVERAADVDNWQEVDQLHQTAEGMF